MAVNPVVICLSRSGEAVAHRIASELQLCVHGRAGRVDRADAFFDNALDHVRALFAAGVPVIGVCASGILVRAVAPVLTEKRSEPPVLSVADDGSVVVPLIGGHYGANRLAKKISGILNAVSAITTAGDVAMGVALDEPPRGWVLANPEHAKPVMASLLAGEAARIEGENIWDLPHDKDGTVTLLATEAPVEGSPNQLVYHPQRFTVGLGCARGCSSDEMLELVQTALASAGIARGTVGAIGSLDLKADEPAMHAVQKWLKVPFRVFTADELELQAPRLATPSDIVFAEVGCHGVAEGAALTLAGPKGDLRVTKQKSANATVAIAKTGAPLDTLAGRARGKLALVGIGPGQASWRTPEASALIAEAEELVGYGLYIDLLGPVAAGKKRMDFPLGGEEDRCRYALEQAGKGRSVALICSGDSGIYAMGALVFELLDRPEASGGVSDAARRTEVISTPGVSALQGAAARVGAPLGHDFCAISLSDLLTPRDDILKRIKAAAEGDFVIAFYNPVSRRRRTLLAHARDTLLEHRPADTPVLLASSLGRPEEETKFCRLDALDVDDVDMLTVVLVGSSQTRLTELGDGPRMFTPRGYARKIDGDLS